MIVSRPEYPRARRMALMVASVPELTMRTISMDGTAEMIISASRISPRVGAPKLVPRSRAAEIAAITSGSLYPRIMGPQEPT